MALFICLKSSCHKCKRCLLFTLESLVIEQCGRGVQTILPFCCLRGFRVVTKNGGESNSEGFLLGLFFLYFPLKVAGGHIHSSGGKSPAPAS